MSVKEIAETARKLLNDLFPNGQFSSTRILNEQEVQDFLEIIVAEGLEPSESSDGQFTGGIGMDEYVYNGELYKVWYGYNGYLNIEVGSRVDY